MNNILLKHLRKEAKRNIYLEPFRLKDEDVSEIIIVNKKYKFYYGKSAFTGSTPPWEFHPDPCGVTTPTRIEHGY